MPPRDVTATPTLEPILDITRRKLLAAIPGLVVLAGGVSCGDDDDGDDTTPTAGPTRTATATPEGPSTRIVKHALGETEIPAEPKRIVALGEEFMLADLLDLGVQPIASTASGSNGTFIGLESHDLSDIEPIAGFELDLEALAALQPDLIVIWESGVESAGGAATLSQIAPFVAITLSPDFRTTYSDIAAIFGQEARATERVAEYNDAAKKAGESLDAANRTVSVATIYPGGSITVYVDGPIDLPQALLDIGFALVPDAAAFPPTRSSGRAELSLEQVQLLAGDDLLLLQSSAIEGEDAAVAQVTGSATWALIPAQAASRVHTVDRFGHPGLAGRIRLIGELEAELAR